MKVETNLTAASRNSEACSQRLKALAVLLLLAPSASTSSFSMSKLPTATALLVATALLAAR